MSISDETKHISKKNGILTATLYPGFCDTISVGDLFCHILKYPPRKVDVRIPFVLDICFVSSEILVQI